MFVALPSYCSLMTTPCNSDQSRRSLIGMHKYAPGRISTCIVTCRDKNYKCVGRPEGQAKAGKAKRNPWLKTRRRRVQYILLPGSSVAGFFGKSFRQILCCNLKSFEVFLLLSEAKREALDLLYVALANNNRRTRKDEDRCTQTSFNIGVQAGVEP
jgi:hypothetical protein